jgi:hypothetical protein
MPLRGPCEAKKAASMAARGAALPLEGPMLPVEGAAMARKAPSMALERARVPVEEPTLRLGGRTRGEKSAIDGRLRGNVARRRGMRGGWRGNDGGLRGAGCGFEEELGPEGPPTKQERGGGLVARSFGARERTLCG